jgi:hypothetical protein
VANIALQETGPVNAADHFAIGSHDPAGYAIAATRSPTTTRPTGAAPPR